LNVEKVTGSLVKNSLSVMVVVLSMLLLSACNMWSGLGKDVQKLGKKMEEAGDRHR
jgi:predicted small secreted protein